MKQKPKRTMDLRFLGRDAHERPVYEDADGRLWKDTSPSSRWSEKLCTSCGNSYDGEPDTPMQYMTGYQDVDLVFRPRRDLWDDPVSQEELDRWNCREGKPA